MRQTSLLRLEQNLFAKAEYENPTGSVKDRAANMILEDAIKRGVLKPGGAVFFEIGESQGEALRRMLADYGFRDIRIEKDFAGHDRYASARLADFA